MWPSRADNYTYIHLMICRTFARIYRSNLLSYLIGMGNFATHRQCLVFRFCLTLHLLNPHTRKGNTRNNIPRVPAPPQSALVLPEHCSLTQIKSEGENSWGLISPIPTGMWRNRITAWTGINWALLAFLNDSPFTWGDLFLLFYCFFPFELD